VRFAYYDRLSRREKELYDRSDRIRRIDLPHAEALRPMVEVVEAAAARLVEGITAGLGVAPVEVGVLAVRPRLRAAELHGLYTRDEKRRARIRVWMRTVHYRRVVAFRTFLRTLLHEVCHHLDYCHLRLAGSLHTEGFFQRESSLFYQLVPPDQGPTARSSAESTGQ
jgi:hypothetical protein